MAMQTTRDILDHVRKLYARLRSYHEQVGKSGDTERTRALHAWMLRHETRIEEAVAEYERDAGKGILDRWFRHGPDFAACEAVLDVDVDHEPTSREVIARTLAFDECLRRVFSDLADLALEPALKELFTDLARTEDDEERAAAQLALDLEQD